MASGLEPSTYVFSLLIRMIARMWYSIQIAIHRRTSAVRCVLNTSGRGNSVQSLAAALFLRVPFSSTLISVWMSAILIGSSGVLGRWFLTALDGLEDSK